MREEKLFELIKGLLAGGGPIPLVVFLGEVKEGVGDCGVVRDEPTVKVDKVQERLHILDFGGGWPGSNTIKLDRIHGKLSRFHDHSKIFHFGDVELAFLEFEVEVKLHHPLEHTMSSFFKGFWIKRGDEKVIHVDDELSFSDHVPEGIIHDSLERGRGVAETEEHNHRFKESSVCDESHLPLVAIFDMNIVVPPLNVKLGEVVSVFQLVH